MRVYKKPTLEVISMRTSENIADSFIKNVYVKVAQGDGYSYDATRNEVYDPSRDLAGSAAPTPVSPSIEG